MVNCTILVKIIKESASWSTDHQLFKACHLTPEGLAVQVNVTNRRVHVTILFQEQELKMKMC